MSTIKSPAEFDSIIELIRYFKDEATCLQYLGQWVHGGDIKCPHCGFDKPYRYKNGRLFKCRSCHSQFTAKIGTIFENSRLPLIKWFTAMYLISSNKKGISSKLLSKQIGVAYRIAWSMSHKIRKALKQQDIELGGIVESDETFVGGKNKNRHKDKKAKYAKSSGRNTKDKTPVLGMLERGGNLKTIVIPNVENSSIRPHVLETVKWGSTLITDAYKAYRTMRKFYDHQVVKHSGNFYKTVAGATTNNIEGFWSQLKRMIIGVYHRVSKKHLQKYCDELTFRFNTRHMKDGERFALLLSKCNIRVTYKQLIA